MPLVLGIDLGGTKVLAGVIDVGTGQVLSSAKKRSHASLGPDELVERVVEVAKEALKGRDAAGPIYQVGIGVAGQINRHKGIVISAPNLANMRNVKLAEIVQNRLNLPVKLFNDVEAAAAGEATYGAGRGKKDFIVVFVGTGIGGAIYRNGRPYGGATHTAGELGHMVVDVNGRLCGCGGFGHLEAYASRSAIVRSILAGMHAGRESVLSDLVLEVDPSDPGGSGIRSKALAMALEAGDALTREMLLTAADYLAAGLASIINFYNPPLIILGGGLVEAVDFFFTAVATRTRNATLLVPRQHIEIVKAGLGDNSGIVGASTLASP